MTLFVDADYAWLSLALRPECDRRGIALETSDLNTRGFGDLLYITERGTYSGEVKGSAEILGGLAHCEAQLQKQLASADRCFLAVYGKVEQAPDGGSYALESPGNERVQYDHGPDSGISRTYKRRHFRQNYLGYRTWLARLVSLGVDVYEVPSREALVVQLLGLYTVLTTEGDTLRRIIVDKPVVSEQDPAKARFMRQLMGLEAGVGEELADALWPKYQSIFMLMSDLLDGTLPDSSIASLPMRNGKRTVGPAAVKRLREALGI